MRVAPTKNAIQIPDPIQRWSLYFKHINLLKQLKISTLTLNIQLNETTSYFAKIFLYKKYTIKIIIKKEDPISKSEMKGVACRIFNRIPTVRNKVHAKNNVFIFIIFEI